MRGLALFATYLAAVVWSTWPLASVAASSLPCSNLFCGVDVLYSAWVLAWQSHALVTAPGHLLDGNIYAPVASAVLYGPAGFGALPYFAPTFLVTGNPALALNVMLLACSALTATGLHVLVRRLSGDGVAGAIAALTVLTSGWLLRGFVASAPHLAALQLFPFIILLSIAPLAGARRVALLALLIFVQCLTDPVYVALAVLGPLALLVLVRLSRRRSRRQGSLLGVAVLLAVLGLLPVYLAYASVRAANPQLAEQTAWQNREDAVAPSELFSRPGSPLALSSVLVGLIVVGAGVAVVRRRWRAPSGLASAWRHGVLWLASGAVLSVPPSANGSLLAFPQTVLARWTSLYDVVRAPSRLGVAGLMGICLLAGAAYAEIDDALSARAGRRPRVVLERSALAVVVLLLLLVADPQRSRAIRARYPVQLAPVVPSEFVVPLRAGRAPLVHLPALLSALHAPGVAWHARAMYQSLAHWRPLLNGYSSYWPQDFLPNMMLAEELPDAQALNELVRRTGVGMIWVDLDGLPAARRAAWTSPALASVGPRLDLVARSGSKLLFAVVPDDGERS